MRLGHQVQPAAQAADPHFPGPDPGRRGRDRVCQPQPRLALAAHLDERPAPDERQPVAVLLVDVHLGDGDGRDLVRELVERDGAPRIALLTGTYELPPDERAGADALIEKPFTLVELLSTVRRLAGYVDS